MRGGCVIHRCQNKTPDKMGPGRWMTSCPEALRIWGFEKKQWVEFLPRRKKVDFRGPPRLDDFVRYGRRALVGLRANDVKAASIERLCVCVCVCVCVSLSLLLKYLAGWRGGRLFGDKRFLWSSRTVLSGDALRTAAIQLTCDLCLAYLYVPNFKHRLQKILLVEKIWLVEK